MSTVSSPDRAGNGAENFLHEEAPCGLVLTDGDGLFLRANAIFLEWFGYELPELVERRRFQDLLSVGGRIFYQTHIGPLLDMQGSVAEVKFDIKHRDGHTLPILTNIADRPNGQGKLRQIAVFMAKDRAKYEHELVLARQRAEDLRDQLDRARELAEDRALFAEQMVAIVSHDLRNPLMAISLGVEAVQRDSVTPRQQQLLARMGTAVDRASRLANDLLDFTQARVGGGIRVHPVPVDVHACTRGALAELRLALPNRRLVHIEEGHAQQLADADRIAQFIGNLVGNANAYGDAALPITVSSIGKPDGFEIHVHNHGPPIPEHLLKNMFEPMTRGEQASEGIGLGLFIVSQIVKAHGGHMEVHSSRSDGTSFRGHFAAGRVPG
jgi:sigma-B regulation protein RsbU (phosphoserine phosphatase)